MRFKINGGNETVESIEASGKSVDDAVLQALSRLGKRRDEVDVMVLQEPSRGTFGIGSKDARVRVTVRRPAATSAVITPEMADAILGPDDTFDEEGPYVDEVLEDEEEFEDEDEDFVDDEEEFEEGDVAEEVVIPVSVSTPLDPVAGRGLGDVSAAEGE